MGDADGERRHPRRSDPDRRHRRGRRRCTCRGGSRLATSGSAASSLAEAARGRPGPRPARSSRGRAGPQQAADGCRRGSGHRPPRRMHLGYWRAVADALDAGEPLPIGPVEARRSVELVTAIYTSALEDRTVVAAAGPDADLRRWRDEPPTTPGRARRGGGRERRRWPSTAARERSPRAAGSAGARVRLRDVAPLAWYAARGHQHHADRRRTGRPLRAPLRPPHRARATRC